MSRKKSLRSTSFKFTEIGSPVYFLISFGAAAACGAAAASCGAGADGPLAGLASPEYLPVKEAGSGISGTRMGVSFRCAGLVTGRKAVGVVRTAGAANEIVTLEPSV